MLLKHLLQVLIILWSGLVFAFEAKTNVKFSKVAKAELYNSYQAIGEVKATYSRDFYAKKSGVITYITSKLGQKVNQGEILIEIDGSLNKAMYNKALTNFDSAQFTFKKDQGLFDKKFISEDAFKKAKFNYETAKFDLEHAKQQYNETIITSPFEGNIGVASFKVGDNVRNDEFLISITKGHEKEITVNLPAKFTGQINLNTKVEIQLNDRDISTEIISISPHLSKLTDNFLVKLKAVDQNLNHNSFVKVKFRINEHTGLLIPESSVRRDEQGSFVFVESESKAKKLYIKLGTRSKGGIEALSGLNEDQNIVSEGLTNLFDGSAIKSNE